ncbi:hypothetical protein L6R52_19575 [Myxococcota bacterium]|nr:hypothetical protein [Myxococcota bacterium]
MKASNWVSMFAAVAAVSLARPALADDATLHAAQAGALLQYADAEVQVLFGCFLAKEFDPELVKSTLSELERSITGAKRSIERSRIIADDQKLEGEYTKLLDIVKRAEKQLSKLAADVEEQTGKGGGDGEEKAAPQEESKAEGGDAEGEVEAKRDWNLLKNGAGWLYVDIKDARTAHGNVSKKLKGTGVKAPPKPAGKREG